MQDKGCKRKNNIYQKVTKITFVNFVFL